MKLAEQYTMFELGCAEEAKVHFSELLKTETPRP